MSREINNVECARDLFNDGFNCSQVVFAAFAPELDIDRSTALKIASSFGGGMAQMGQVCGAVTGALMVLGLKYGRTKAGDSETKERNYELVREFVRRFKERHGAIGCAELLGYDISKPNEKAIVKEKNLFHTLCPKFVEGAVEILGNSLREG